MPLFATPFAQLDLVRQPEQDGEPLQAFDAADEYLLNQLHERGVTAQCRVLVLNDAFGALAASLAPHVQVTSSGDSHLGFLALRKNLARNGLDLGSVRFVPASETAVGPFDHVLVNAGKVEQGGREGGESLVQSITRYPGAVGCRHYPCLRLRRN